MNGKVWNVATGFLSRFHEHMEEEDFRARMLAFVKQERPKYIYIFGHSLGIDFCFDNVFQKIEVVQSRVPFSTKSAFRSQKGNVWLPETNAMCASKNVSGK